MRIPTNKDDKKVGRVQKEGLTHTPTHSSNKAYIIKVGREDSSTQKLGKMIQLSIFSLEGR